MNTMKDFYASITSASRLHGSYLEALSEITTMSHQQSNALKNDLGWQDWTEQTQRTAV
jgi:hypothetical protein